MMDTYLKNYADAGLYVMQGRLGPAEDDRFQCFPSARWREEIESASRVGLRGIEWIYDAYGEGSNPLETPAGREELRSLLDKHQVSVVSVCADYFMDMPFLRCTDQQRGERLARLQWLIGVCAELNITRIVLPFVDASRIQDVAERLQVVATLKGALDRAEVHQVELHLETDLSPDDFKALLQSIDHPMVKVNYDAGNSASLGYAPEAEFQAYGQWVGSVHIKDRRLRGTTVPLGDGNTDFSALRQMLVDYSYRGDFVLQVARGKPGDELNWMRHVSNTASDWLRGDLVINHR